MTDCSDDLEFVVEFTLDADALEPIQRAYERLDPSERRGDVSAFVEGVIEQGIRDGIEKRTDLLLDDDPEAVLFQIIIAGDARADIGKVVDDLRCHPDVLLSGGQFEPEDVAYFAFCLGLRALLTNESAQAAMLEFIALPEDEDV